MSFLKSIKEITKDMSVYGLSTVLSQIVGLLLLPLYTKELTPSDYGTFSLMGILVASYAVVSNLGISSAIFRFTGTSTNETEKQVYLNQAQLLNIGSNLVFMLLALALSKPLSTLLLGSESSHLFILYFIVSGTLSSVASVCISFLRIERKTKTIATASLINLVVSVSATFIGLVVLRWGVWGALAGGLLGDLAAFTWYMRWLPKPQWSGINKRYAVDLLKFAMPIFPHKILGLAIPIVSQLILVKYLSLESLGYYNVAYKFCVPLAVFINLFQRAYTPFRFEILKNKDTNQSLFAQINLFYITLTLLFFSAISLFGALALQLFTAERYHAAGAFIPYLALIPLTQGLYFIFGTGVEFSHSPRFYPVISGLGFVLILILAIWLIPSLEIIGAGIATSIGWVFMGLMMLWYAQKVYYIKYHWKQILPLLLLTSFVISINLLINTNNWITSLILYFGQLMLFIIILKPYLNTISPTLQKIQLKFSRKSKA
jgi:O-antigen/teichoic acid export membrane protein